MTLVHWHRHSEFSQNYAPDGSGNAEEYAERAAELGMPALGHTDHATLGGALDHIRECRKRGIFPIVGVEAYFRYNRRHVKEDGVDSSKAMHLCLHAGSMRGWKNLLAATTKAFTTGDASGEGYYGKPVMDWEILEQHCEGVWCSTACVYSPIAVPFLEGREEEGVSNFKRLREIFKDRLALEIMCHDYDPQRLLNPFLWNLGQTYSTRVIATGDAHMVRKEHSKTHHVLTMDSTGQTFESRKAKKDAGEDVYGSELTTLYLMDEGEMMGCFEQYHPDMPRVHIQSAMDETHEMVKDMHLWYLDTDEKYPRIEGDALEILDKWCWDGLKRIGKLGDEEYEKRWKYERSVLIKNNVVPYFVIVGELVRWAKSELGLPRVDADGKLVRNAAGEIQYEDAKKPIRVGLGRGSAAGCLVSYLVGIVGIDPIAYDLLFERFLNPDRKGMPDIDLDFSSKGREMVKEYLRRMYGYDHVADVVSHQMWAPRAIIKDLGRVYDIPYGEIEKVNKTIDAVKDRGWVKVREQNPVLKAFCEKYPDLNRDGEIIDEHVHRKSKHAAAVIVTKDPVVENIPLELSKPSAKSKGAKATVVTAWSNRADFEIISDFGFLKLDILGVTGLDRQDLAVEKYQMRDMNGNFLPKNPFKRGATASSMLEELQIDPAELPILYAPDTGEQKVLEKFGEGATIGVFQFHTGGMTALLRAVKPTHILHLGIVNALYRPGAMEYAYEFAKRLNGEVPESEWYWHPSVKPYMQETCGVLAFQEQVMAICKGLGNFTGGQADGIRKGISKWYRLGKEKCIEKLREAGFETQWFKGTAENNLPRAAAELIWNNILDFAGYGFNKSHSMSYALQAYQDMWIKVYHPTEFYASILSYPDDDKGWIERVVREARSFNVNIKPPDINLSGMEFTVNGDDILFGLLAVKGIGDATVYEVLEKRPFEGWADYCQKTGSAGAGMALVKAGAFEELDGREFLLGTVQKGQKPVTVVRFNCGEEITCRTARALEEPICPTHAESCGEKHRREVWEKWTVAEHIAHNRKLKNPRPLPPERQLPTTRELMDAEKDMLGVLISVEPSIEKYWPIVQSYVDTQGDFERMSDGDDVQIAGEIVGVKKINTKGGKPMCFIDIAHGSDVFSCTCFTGEFLRYADVLEEADSIIVGGRKNTYNDRQSIIVNRLQHLEDFVQETKKRNADQ